MNNVFQHDFAICRNGRNRKNGHNSFVVWFTGLSGSGKSTIANGVEKELFRMGLNSFILDGDNIRLGINKDLGFSQKDREENQRRVAEIAKLFVEAGIILIACFVSPLEENRSLVKGIIGAEDFIEVFVDTSIQECEKRDAKGLYKKARSGEIKNFTGISAPYEKPGNPDVLINTEAETVDQSINRVMAFIQKRISNKV